MGGIHQKYLDTTECYQKDFLLLFIKVQEDTVIVYAVVDCRQNPEKIETLMAFSCGRLIATAEIRSLHL